MPEVTKLEHEIELSLRPVDIPDPLILINVHQTYKGSETGMQHAWPYFYTQTCPDHHAYVKTLHRIRQGFIENHVGIAGIYRLFVQVSALLVISAGNVSRRYTKLNELGKLLAADRSMYQYRELQVMEPSPEYKGGIAAL